MEETRGGKRKGAGRKSKIDEEKVNSIMLSALSELHNTDNDKDTKKEFAKSLLKFERGKMFIAEHVFGKPKEIIENINHNFNQDLTEENVTEINKFLENKY
jgi:hypothetical protein